jgi:transposase
MVSMYIARVPNRNSPPAFLLRESYRENGQVKSRTIANLTAWSEARRQAVARALRGELDQAALPEPVLGTVFGLLFVLKQIADALGIGSALGNTRLAKLGLFLVLARVAHQGSRLSAVRWAEDHAVAEVLGLKPFDEDDLYAALDDLCARQEKIEQQLFAGYLKRKGTPPRLFLYDVTSSYLEGERNALGEYGYDRDGKKGKMQIVIGLLTDQQGEPLAVRVFAGNTADPTTVADPIKILREQFQVEEFVFVGDRGMVKSKSIQALHEAGLRYITALTDPQIRSLLREKVLQLDLFSEAVCEVESGAVRYILRRNHEEAARIQHRLEDKLAKLEAKLKARNELVQTSTRCSPEAGLRQLDAWANRHKLTGLVELKLEGRQLVWQRLEEKITRALDLAGCYVITTDVASASMNAQQVHDSYMDLENVERDFRTMKTGLLEVRPIFVRKESRTRGHVFCSMLALKLSREIERRLRLRFGTTDTDPYAITLPDALEALRSLSLLHYKIDEKITLTKLPKPNANQLQILDALEVKLPTKV